VHVDAAGGIAESDHHCIIVSCGIRLLICHAYLGMKYLSRWAHLLKQQTSITVYRLPTEENKLPFSVCSKQTKVAVFH
jgi:hypothetical protein